MNATQLLATANGMSLDTGKNRCFYCGSPCDDARPLRPAVKANRKYITDTFTDWASVAYPESDYCCVGCSIALNEKSNINGRSGQKMRNYSWIITRDSATAMTKADVIRIREACLDPPQPPFAIVIAASGQKHTLFRAPSNNRRDIITIQFETEQVTYRPVDLSARLQLVAKLITAVGKTKLSESVAVSNAIKLFDQYGDSAQQLIESWNRMYCEPLSRLAVFLTPSLKKGNADDK